MTDNKIEGKWLKGTSFYNSCLQVVAKKIPGHLRNFLVGQKWGDKRNRELVQDAEDMASTVTKQLHLLILIFYMYAYDFGQINAFLAKNN